jgi:hypothetical protein
VLTLDLKITRLSNKQGEFKVDLEIHVAQNPGINDLCSKMTHTLWNRFILREGNIITLVNHPDQEKGMMLCASSCKSELSINLEPLCFDHDRKQVILKQGRQFKKGHYSVVSLQQVPWMGKNIFEIHESKNYFFLIKNQLSSRRIDVMRLDTEQSQRQSQLLIGNSYIAI